MTERLSLSLSLPKKNQWSNKIREADHRVQKEVCCLSSFFELKNILWDGFDINWKKKDWQRRKFSSNSENSDEEEYHILAGMGWIVLKQTRMKKIQALRAEVLNRQREMGSWEINWQNRRQKREERSLGAERRAWVPLQNRENRRERN